MAISAKTLDTLTTARTLNPEQIYHQLKNNVDAVVNFSGATLGGRTVSPSDIAARELQVAVRDGATAAQWGQINRAVQYGQSQGVYVKITVAKP